MWTLNFCVYCFFEGIQKIYNNIWNLTTYHEYFLVCTSKSFFKFNVHTKEQISMIFQRGSWIDEEIQYEEFLGFVFGEAAIPKLPLAPGLYKYLPYASRYSLSRYSYRHRCDDDDPPHIIEREWGLILNDVRGYCDRYAIVKPSGHKYLVSFRLGEEPFKSIGTAIADLWPDLSLYQQQLETVTTSWISFSEIVKILPEEEFERLTEPRPFSICLAGRYKSGRTEVAGGEIRCPESITVSSSGSVSWTSACELGRKGFITSPETISLQVESVSRNLDNWTVKLHAGEEPRIEVVYPPLCVLQLSNGKSVDLSKWGFSGESALLSSTRISYHGKIKETEGSECIVSFPGRYADGWRECVEASAHDMGVACVFLCGKDDGFGEHAIDPDAGGGSICYCHNIYGQRNFNLFGYETEEECIANGNRPTWGCLWFQKWRNNVEVAVERKQRLVAYFFVGQVGQGLVAWDDLATADLWAGRGLGGSQKGDSDFIDQRSFGVPCLPVQTMP